MLADSRSGLEPRTVRPTQAEEETTETSPMDGAPRLEPKSVSQTKITRQ